MFYLAVRAIQVVLGWADSQWERSLTKALRYVLDHDGESKLGAICGYAQLEELERRGFVRVSKEGGLNSYRITDAGRLEVFHDLMSEVDAEERPSP